MTNKLIAVEGHILELANSEDMQPLKFDKGYLEWYFEFECDSIILGLNDLANIERNSLAAIDQGSLDTIFSINRERHSLKWSCFSGQVCG